jgi:phage N-6-adenine-methyltransferase
MHWDKKVQAAGNQSNNARGHYLSVSEAEKTWGILQPTVSRWRKWTSPDQVDAYRERIMFGALRVAGFESEHNHRAQGGNGESEWFTPSEHVEAAREVLGEIDLDPATHPVAQRQVQAADYFTVEDDALSREWSGKVWLNPPYSRTDIGLFIEKLLGEIASGRVTEAILLTHHYTDTAWFQAAAAQAAMICFPKGRIKFTDAAGEECNPTQGQAFFYYGVNEAAFAATFRRFGFLVRVVKDWTHHPLS